MLSPARCFSCPKICVPPRFLASWLLGIQLSCQSTGMSSVHASPVLLISSWSSSIMLSPARCFSCSKICVPPSMFALWAAIMILPNPLSITLIRGFSAFSLLASNLTRMQWSPTSLLKASLSSGILASLSLASPPMMVCMSSIIPYNVSLCFVRWSTVGRKTIISR